MIYLLFYVDDMFVVVRDIGKINCFKKNLDKMFEMKDFGLVFRIFGMDIKRNRKNGVLKFL